MEIEQMKEELNHCLSEQGFDWYEGKSNLVALALLGLLELHKEDIEKIALAETLTMNEGLAQVCDGLAKISISTPKQRKQFKAFAKIFRKLETTDNKEYQ